MIVNLISDTVTRPTKDMLAFMFQAEVGDDVFQADPTVNALQEKAAAMFGKEAAIFCPSGTMTNQMAMNLHTRPLDEVICDHYSHVYQYETGGHAFHSGISMNLIQGENGKITAEQVESAIKPKYDWLPESKLVVLENTCNKGGGSYYTMDEIAPIQSVCRQHKLKLHLDGARLFNALVETQDSPLEIGQYFDSISICLSKGLGAPVGSLLIGNKDFIQRGRRLRKVMGGGMRQAGYLAAAGIYALDHHVERLKEDNNRAKLIGDTLTNCAKVKQVHPVKSNIVIFDLADDLTATTALATLEAEGVLGAAFGPNTVRLVTHLDISEDMIQRTIEVIQKVFN